MTNPTDTRALQALADKVEAGDDLVDRIAKEIAALVSDHIESMYPDAAKAVAWGSCRRSIQGVIRNGIAAAGKAAEIGKAEDWISTSAKNRRRFRALIAGGRT